MSLAQRMVGMVAALAFGAAGCAGEDGVEGPGPDVAAAETVAGRYELSTRIELTETRSLPGGAGRALTALAGLADSPGRTMLDLAAASEVPELETLLALLPESLEAELVGWIDDWVFAQQHGSVPVAAQIAAVGDDVAAIFTGFEVVSTLEILPADATGHAYAVHQVTGVAFSVGGERLLVLAPEAHAPLLLADGIDTTAVHIVESSPLTEDARVDLGHHGVALPAGELALAALDQLLMARFGVAGVRGALALLLPCDQLAASVAASCVGPLCVGHQAELAGVCDGALDALAAEVEQGIRSLDLQVVQFAAGEARMWDLGAPDDERDGVIDLIDRGRWVVGLDFGQGSVEVDASFTGRRVGLR